MATEEEWDETEAYLTEHFGGAIYWRNRSSDQVHKQLQGMNSLGILEQDWEIVKMASIMHDIWMLDNVPFDTDNKDDIDDAIAGLKRGISEGHGSIMVSVDTVSIPNQIVFAIANSNYAPDIKIFDKQETPCNGTSMRLVWIFCQYMRQYILKSMFKIIRKVL